MRDHVEIIRRVCLIDQVNLAENLEALDQPDQCREEQHGRQKRQNDVDMYVQRRCSIDPRRVHDVLRDFRQPRGDDEAGQPDVFPQEQENHRERRFGREQIRPQIRDRRRRDEHRDEQEDFENPVLTVEHRRDKVREHDHQRNRDDRERARVDQRHAVVFVRQHGREVFKSRELHGLGLGCEGVVED